MMPDKTKQNGPGDVDTESTIRELRLLIRMEEEKPEAERDEALINECIREIANLKGVRSSHSQEEVDAVIADLKNKDKVKRAAPRRIVRWLIPIAAVLALATTAAAVSTNSLRVSDITKWFLSTLHPKTSYSEENVDLILTDDIKEYTTLEELAEAVEIPLLLPFEMEEDMQNIVIRLSDYGEFQVVMITFAYQSSSCWFTIHYKIDLNAYNDLYNCYVCLKQRDCLFTDMGGERGTILNLLALNAMHSKETTLLYTLPGINDEHVSALDVFGAIPKSTQNKLNAWRLLKILLSDEIQTDPHCLWIYQPVTKSAAAAFWERKAETYPTLLKDGTAARLGELLLGIDRMNALTPIVKTYLHDDLQPYLAGEKSFDACLENLMRDLEFYKDE